MEQNSIKDNLLHCRNLQRQSLIIIMRRLQWIKQNIIHNLKQYIFLLILIEGDWGRFKVSKKSSPAMQTPNCLHSATKTSQGMLIAMNKLGSILVRICFITRSMTHVFQCLEEVTFSFPAASSTSQIKQINCYCLSPE